MVLVKKRHKKVRSKTPNPKPYEYIGQKRPIGGLYGLRVRGTGGLSIKGAMDLSWSYRVVKNNHIFIRILVWIIGGKSGRREGKELTFTC